MSLLDDITVAKPSTLMGRPVIPVEFDHPFQGDIVLTELNASPLHGTFSVPAELLTDSGFDLTAAIRAGLVSGVKFTEEPPLPPVTDETACGLLMAWAKKPWEPVYKAMLRDRFDELDRHDLIERLEKLFPAGWVDNQAYIKANGTRTRLRGHLRWWKRRLKQAIPYEG